MLQTGLLDIRHVSKMFTVDARPVHALRDVSLRVEPGEFVSLVGASGCGKSTLLRLVAGLDTPDEGSIAVDGQAVNAPSLKRGIVFQDHRLFPWLSVLDNVLLGLHKADATAAQRLQRAAELISLVGLAGFENAFPHQLSGGMAQRAAIARSLAPSPEVLLLDEPLGALDSLTRSHLQEELLRIWRHQRTTMLMVTHDVEEAIFLSDRVVLLGSRPGHIRTQISVNLPHPRRRASAQVIAIKEHLLDLLAGETQTRVAV
ncbi:ABC transporter ATP-binding protein [Terrihabitans rhizophilus]|uniref:ABC transporter ATP-binding protein n=1 Tax=Terrihabitans rhizophilus TaxID=3092662 RepID=A0ABU4RQ39_9HYPH|nr:ABC transporter ATP-binding protein [Terrihabitans sp. PJ23]MDX6806963.1 ABC transporter ATP-binding protein [Terrihabitans sp. PJ23]